MPSDPQPPEAGALATVAEDEEQSENGDDTSISKFPVPSNNSKEPQVPDPGALATVAEDEEQFQKVMAKKQVDQPATFVPVTLMQNSEQSKHSLAPLQNKLSESKNVSQQLAMEILTPTGNIFRVFGNTDPGLLRVILASLGRHEC